MALFVDGPAGTINDLVDQDAGLLAVSQTAGIDVADKLRLAQEEIRTELELWLIKQTRWVNTFGPAAAHRADCCHFALEAVGNNAALELVYRDAYFSQLVDRYQAKWQEYAKLARDARESLSPAGWDW